MIMTAKDTPAAQRGGVNHFFVYGFFYQISFLQLMERERLRGLWVERLIRAQPGQRVGRPRLPHRLVSLCLHITYHFGWLFGCFCIIFSFCRIYSPFSPAGATLMHIAHLGSQNDFFCLFCFLLLLVVQCMNVT